jgi:hypothetical protein
MATTPLHIAQFQIGSESRPLRETVLDRAARTLGILTKDENGRRAIPSEAIPILRGLYRSAGVLMPRGCRSWEELKRRVVAE